MTRTLKGLLTAGLQAPHLLQDLEMNVRRKIYKKRAVASVFWTLSTDVQMAVKLFNLVQRAYPSKHVSVDLRTSQLLRITGANICNDTGNALLFSSKAFNLMHAWPELSPLLFAEY